MTTDEGMTPDIEALMMEALQEVPTDLAGRFAALDRAAAVLSRRGSMHPIAETYGLTETDETVTYGRGWATAHVDSSGNVAMFRAGKLPGVDNVFDTDNQTGVGIRVNGSTIFLSLVQYRNCSEQFNGNAESGTGIVSNPRSARYVAIPGFEHVASPGGLFLEFLTMEYVRIAETVDNPSEQLGIMLGIGGSRAFIPLRVWVLINTRIGNFYAGKPDNPTKWSF